MKKYLILILLLFLLGCSDNSDKRVSTMEIKSSIENINLFKNTNIYFGHQSVGNNIIAGIRAIANEKNISDLNIVELDDEKDLPENYFVHSPIGRNRNPVSKIIDFQKNIDSLANKNLKIAMMKFCYVDFNKDTNIEKVFEKYITTIDSIKAKYPNLIIIHFTVPLMAERSFLGKLKAFVKGESDKGFYDNLARNNYNNLLKTKYSSEYIFDLARIESTKPNGEREKQELNGQSCFYLYQGYTSDGGHLNSLGQKLVANELINFIAKISS